MDDRRCHVAAARRSVAPLLITAVAVVVIAAGADTMSIIGSGVLGPAITLAISMVFLAIGYSHRAGDALQRRMPEVRSRGPSAGVEVHVRARGEHVDPFSRGRVTTYVARNAFVPVGGPPRGDDGGALSGPGQGELPVQDRDVRDRRGDRDNPSDRRGQPGDA
jgi:hypothetical protein